MVIDTSLFIEHLRAKDKTKTTLYSIASNRVLFVSTVSIYELYMGATTDEKRYDIEYLTGDLSVLHFTDNVAITAADIYHALRKRNQMIEFRDIFIAATCIVHQLPLATLNRKHFDRIPELVIVDV